MSRNKHRHNYGGKTRQTMAEKAVEREVRDANNGILDGSEEQLMRDIARLKEQDEEQKSFKLEDPRWYVLDTNLILSCVDVLYDPKDELWREPLQFKPNLDNAHLIIPYLVLEELGHMKSESTPRAVVARTALNRLMKFFQNSGRSIDDIINLKEPVRTGWYTQTISILPLHKDFYKCLPWVPATNDNDGWIAVTALAATMLKEGLPVDGSISITERNNAGKDVVLVTNDKQLIAKADLIGVRAKRYSFKEYEPFSGCRHLTVPAKMFAQYFHDEKLSNEDFREYMPNELPLVANEYVIMEPEDGEYPNGYFYTGIKYLNVARYIKGNDALFPLRFAKYEGNEAANAEMAAYYDALNDPSIDVIITTGDAGTGKTFTAVVHAIHEVKAGKFRRIVVIPSQSAKNPLGALPGGEEKKIEPIVSFCKDAIENYLESLPEFQRKRKELRRFGDVNREYEDDEPQSYKEKPRKKKDSKVDFYPSKEDKKEMRGDSENKVSYNQYLARERDAIFERYFTCIPYEMAQGRTFDDAIVILDEFQRVQVDDARTLITRPGKGSKLIVSGDLKQIRDSTPEKRFKNGLNFTSVSYYDEPSAAFVHLTQNMRGGIAATAVKNQEKACRHLGIMF